ncbi:MAG: hypothetical protein GF350_07175, partial [Chitinivibrionales bacterium]|nr:hypothetical protein [Chitinivibrionales bacterium]
MKQLHIQASSIIQPDSDSGWDRNIPPRLKRRDPRIWHMAYAATKLVIDKGTDTPRSIITSTAFGALDETGNFLDSIYKTGFGSPRHFISSVHNSMGGKLAIEFTIKGPNLTFCDGPNSFASAIAACSLIEHEFFPVLVVAVDESIELLSSLRPYLAPECAGFLSSDWREAACAFIIDRNHSGKTPRIASAGP